MQRKATKNTRAANSFEKHYHSWLKNSGVCAACNNFRPVINHHCEGATFKHNKTLIGHWFVIGLCFPCDNIITQGSRKVFREKFGPQSQLWLNRIEEYEATESRRVPEDVKAAIMDWNK